MGHIGISKYDLQGKITRTTLLQLNTHLQKVKVPSTIRTYYNDTEISTNVIHLNNTLFFTLVSEGIHHRTVLAVDNLERDTLERGLKHIVRAYSIRGFHIILILGDIQFKLLKD